MSKNERKLKNSIVVTLIATVLIGSFSVLTAVNNVGASTGLWLKWTANLGLETHVGPLAADLIPEPPGSPRVLEIVVTGVSEADRGFTNGTVAVLNGTDGSVLWTAQPGEILDHSPVEISDLNNDGLPEIVVSNVISTSALFGNGSLYWKNNAAPSYDLYSAIGDVNQDGYPEVFVSSGEAPYAGVDYLTELSHDGQILAQSNTSWHPCWGGLALGDPMFDGNFILLQGDRRSTYNAENDSYTGGGWGVRALDALTMTPLWNDSQIQSSSHIPMFADVNGDGILDVVVAWMGSGLAVYNALDGSVLTSGGIYRKTSNLNLSSHSQPTIYDIDGDGHPEIIVNYDSNPKIFDLYTWTLDATLNFTTGEPPKMGRVTADPAQMNIILVEGSNIHVYDQQYNEVDNATGLDNPNEFTLVQDVDGDGYNELLMTSRSGYVYCYGTPALALTPSPRSNIAFYSEYRLGVAEYVEPSGPKAPQIVASLPMNGAIDLPTNLSTLSFELFDYQRDPINYTVTTTPNIGEASGTNVPNGRYIVSVTDLNYSTTYSWTVSVTDGKNSNATTFSFAAVQPPPDVNIGSLISSESPPNGATGVAISLSTLSFDLTNFQGKPMNYTVYTTPNVGSGSGTNVIDDRYNIRVSGLSYSTAYSWTVNVTNGELYNATTFRFTTQAPHLTIVQQIQAIKYEVMTLVSNRTLSGPQGKTLTNQLDNAISNFSDGKYGEAINHLEEFISQVNQLVREHDLTQIQANKLVIPAEDAIDRICALVLPGDLNGDKTVNIYDSLLLVGRFFMTSLDPAWDSKYDLQKDGIINIFDALVLSANFGKSWPALTVNTIGSGSVTKNPDQASYASGSLVSLAAVPAAGWTFSGWGGDRTGSANPTTITMNGNKAVTANFAQGTFTITAAVQGTGGTIAPSGTVQVLGGQDITFILSPSTGYHVQSVTIDGTNIGSLSSYTFNDVAANHSINPTFATNQYTLTIIVSGGGKVMRAPSKTSYSYGETVTLTAIPNKNRVFLRWSGDLTGTANPATIVMNSNKTVYAAFAR